MEVADHL